MSQPSQQSDMKGPDPVNKEVPTEDGGYQTYRAAGKLKGKKAIITGGDSGIGRATAILYAMEGADSMIAYLPDEQKDAEETKEAVEKHGAKCYLFPTDLTKKENCAELVDKAVSEMGAINILVNNAAYQNMIPSISELSEHVPPYLLLDDSKANANLQRAMAQDLRHQHPPLLLRLQVRPRAHEERRHHLQLRLRQRIHRPPRPTRLHLLQRRHRGLHPRAAQPADCARNPRQCRLPRSRLDSPDPLHHEQRGPGSVQRYTHGSSGTAVGDCNLLRFLGQSGQQYDLRPEFASERRCCG